MGKGSKDWIVCWNGGMGMVSGLFLMGLPPSIKSNAHIP